MNISQEINEALNYRKAGDFENAEKIWLDILKKYPDNSKVLPFLGVLYYEMEKYQLALKYLEKAYKVNQNNVIIKTLAFSYFYLGKVSEAKKFLKLCTEFEKTPEVYNKLITLMIVCDYDYRGAYKFSLELYEKYPFDTENIIHLSEICLHIGDFKNSASFCSKALALKPEYPKAWIQKGILEEVLNLNDIEARKCFKKALRLGDKQGAYHNLCINYSHSDREKSDYYGKKLLKMGELNGRNEIMYIMASNYLTRKKMKTGYKYLIHRCDNTTEDVCPYVKIIDEMKKEKAFEGESLFLLFDWGYGDQIMFSRYLPFAAEKFDKVIAMCDKHIINLFKRSFGYLKNVEFVLVKNDYPECGVSMLATHLPDALNIPFDKIPFSGGYLAPDETKILKYKQKYFNIPKLKVGLCWQAGSCALRTLHNRSIGFESLNKLFELNNKIQFYSFQLKSVSSDKKTLEAQNVIDLSETIKDFDDTAALLKNIDILISVDTSVAHLAGALGVKTFLFLPSFCEWRWFDNTEKTEWYDSIRIFKQINIKSCEDEIERMFNVLMHI